MEYCVCHGKAKHAEKPRLEIPDTSSFKLPVNGSSPRSIQGFPLSPQSPEVVPHVGRLKKFEGPSPAPENGRIRICIGEYVLVRCNQSKWLLGQVRRSSRTGLRIWVGVAQTLVEVPFELLGTHLLKLNNPSSSTTSSIDSLEVEPSGQVLAPFHCVRPAHLSHRKLYQPLGVLPKEASTCAAVLPPPTIVKPEAQQAVKLSRSASLPSSFRGDNMTDETEIIPAFIRNKAIAAELPSMMKRPLWPQQPKASSSCSQYIGPSMLGLSKLNQSSDTGGEMQPFSDISENNNAWVTVIENGIRKQGFASSTLSTPSRKF